MAGVSFPLPASLTHEDGHRVSQAIAETLSQAVKADPTGRTEAQRCLHLDAQALERIDSAALAVLLQARRDAQAQGWTLEVRQPPARLTQLAALYGVSALLGWADT